MSDPGKSLGLSPPSDSNDKDNSAANQEIFSGFDVVSLFEQGSKSNAELSSQSSKNQSDSTPGDKEPSNSFEPVIRIDLAPLDLKQYLLPREDELPGKAVQDFENFEDSFQIESEIVELLSGSVPEKVRPLTAFGTDWSEESMSIASTPVFGMVGSDLVSVGREGLVVVDGNLKKPGQDAKIASRELTIDDGTYRRDQQGRVTETRGPGGGNPRAFSFDGSDSVDKPGKVTIGNTTYVRMGPITSNGKPVQRDGYDMYNWKMEDARGNLKGNWYGDMRISEEGVFTRYFNDTNKIVHEGADGKELSSDQAQARNRDGIWPSKVRVTRPDGTRLKASKKGNVVESFEDTVSEDGKDKLRTWKKSSDRNIWTSNQAPGKKLIGLTLDGEGTLKYEDEEGRRIEKRADATSSVLDGDRVYEYDSHHRLDGVESSESKREFGYGVDAGGISSLTSVDTRSFGHESNWRKDESSGKWKELASGKTADKLRVLEDGAIEYVDSDGVKHIETSSLKDIEYDAYNRPCRVSFPDGATRSLEYDKSGLRSVIDRIPVKKTGTVHENTWERDGDDSSFKSVRENGVEYRRTDMEATEYGDLRYKNQDGKEHVARADDLDKISRGEFVLGSESLMEARDRLLQTADGNGINMERFQKWVKEFEEGAGVNELDPGKLVRTMNNLSDLLTEPSRGGQYDLAQRKTIFDTAMHNLARPLEIDQGSHPTCNVTSVEVYAAVRHPDAYTGLIRDVALTGKWKTLAGKTATPPKEALAPGKDEKAYDVDTPDSGKRSLASQAFQMTLINAMYETGEMNSENEDLSDVRYIMKPSKTVTRREGQYTVTIDLGEDSLEKNGKTMTKNGKPVHGPEMIQDDVLRSCEILFGEEPPYIENAGYTDIPGRGRQYSSDLISRERLFEIKEKNAFPVLTPTMGGMHAQTLHDVWQNPKDGQVWVLLDNQHGEPEVKGRDRNSGEGDGDGWIRLETLHKTLRMSGEGRGFGQPVMPKIHKYDHPGKTARVMR